MADARAVASTTHLTVVAEWLDVCPVCPVCLCARVPVRVQPTKFVEAVAAAAAAQGASGVNLDFEPCQGFGTCTNQDGKDYGAGPAGAQWDLQIAVWGGCGGSLPVQRPCASETTVPALCAVRFPPLVPVQCLPPPPTPFLCCCGRTT